MPYLNDTELDGQLMLSNNRSCFSFQLCEAKAFICELCNNDRDFLFPFELGRVTQCPGKMV